MEIDIENIVHQQIVADVLSKISDEDRNAILEKSMTKVLDNVFNTWQVEKAIKADAEKYMAEYIRQPEVQAKIKAGVETAFDNIIDGMVSVFEARIDDAISSKYVSFQKRSD